jgi:hypothetical protein
LDN